MVAIRHRGQRIGLVVGKVVVVLVSSVALASAGVAWFTVHQFKASTNVTTALAQVSSETNLPPADDGATDILLVGDDSRTDAQGAPLPTSVLTRLRTQFDAGLNTDTIILLRLPKNGGKAYAVSIPRDTYVSIPGYRDDKINSAYGVIKSRTGSSVAGEKALIETVQNLTGVRVDHYVEVNLYGFYLLSKAIGGVRVCLKHSTSDPGSGADFASGVQTISGANALSFVRQRKNLPNGDLGRIVRQQVFLAAAAHKVLSAGTLTSPSRLSGLMTAMKKSLVTDPGLDLTTLVRQAQNLLAGNIEFITIPVVNPNARSPRGQSIVQVDVAQVHRFLASLTAPPVATAGPPALAASPPTTHAAAPTTTVAAPPKAPTPPVSIDGVRCVD
ncbi:MAG TPA: LCP family protein [Pseudonocardiaceae bacterium]|nr:LCP family protein [Pseudonocardiaceae bacterium]